MKLTPLASTSLLLALFFFAWGCKDKTKPQPRKRSGETRRAKPTSKPARPLVIYSGRSKRLVAPLLKKFTKATGIHVQAKYAKTAQMALMLQAEIKSKAVKADLFWSQDAGALGLLEGAFAQVPEALHNKVPKVFQHPARKWLATSGRARVLAYAPRKVKAKALPKSIFELTRRKWRGKVGWAPTNASFQAFVTGMRVAHGDEKTKAWLKAMKKNKAKSYPKNTAIIKGIAAGEVVLGIPNHYYLLRFKKKDAKYPVEQTFFKGQNIGNLVNIAGVGIFKSSKNPKAAVEFAKFLLSEKIQQYVTQSIFEYPMLSSVKPSKGLIPLADLLKRTPSIALGKLRDLKGTLALMRGAGVP